MIKRVILFILLLSITGVCEAQQSFQTLTFSASGRGASLRLIGSGVNYSRMSWYTSGTVSSCSVQIDKAVDVSGAPGTWTNLIPSSTCTTEGSSAVTSGNSSWTSINVTALGGGGSVTVTFVGFIAQFVNIGAGSQSTYIINTVDANLPNAQILSALSSGYVKVTTGSGLLSSQTTPIPNADLVGSGALTLNGSSISLGGSKTLTLASSDFANQGTTTTLLHGNAAGNPSFGSVVSADLNITTSSCTNQFLTAISSGGVGTCTTDTLASAQHANQGTTTTVLHGNAAGNPAFSAVSLTADVTGTLAGGNGGTGVNSIPSTGIVVAQNGILGFVAAIVAGSGGTGLTGFSANQIMYGASSTALTSSSSFTFDGTHFITGGTTQVGTSATIVGDNTTQGGASGTLSIIGATNSNLRMNMGYTTNGSGAYIQSVNNGSGDTSLTLNAAGGAIIIGAPGTAGTALNTAGTVYMVSLTAEGGTKSAMCHDDATSQVETNPAATCTVSSLRFKDWVRDLTCSEVDAIVGSMRAAVFQEKKFNPTTGSVSASVLSNTAQLSPRFGFAAEWVEPITKMLVYYESDGVTPRGVDYERFSAVLEEELQCVNTKLHTAGIVGF